MPKNKVKKIGDPRFDQKQPPLDLPNIDEARTYIAALKFRKLVDLMLHFKINPRDEHAWMYLSIELAERYMPGMEISLKRGRPRKWDFNNNLRLYALVEVSKAAAPEASRKEIFNLLPQLAQDSLLEGIITLDTMPSSLETRFDKYTSSTEFQGLKDILNDCTEAQRLEYFHFILHNDF